MESWQPRIMNDIAIDGDGDYHLMLGYTDGVPFVQAVAPDGNRVTVHMDPEQLTSFCLGALKALGYTYRVA